MTGTQRAPADARLRLARHTDRDDIQALIARSARGLSGSFYTAAQTEAALEHVFGVDSQLIDDRTYYILETGQGLAAAGGWSRRGTLYGGDQTKRGADPLLDPSREPARVRAFFVDPRMARCGLARRLLEECVAAARSAGFRAMELMATLPGEPFYAASGFSVVERVDLTLPGGVVLPLARMRRDL